MNGKIIQSQFDSLVVTLSDGPKDFQQDTGAGIHIELASHYDHSKTIGLPASIMAFSVSRLCTDIVHSYYVQHPIERERLFALFAPAPEIEPRIHLTL